MRASRPPRKRVRRWDLLALAVLTACLASIAGGPRPADAAQGSTPIGAHSMLQLNDPYPFMQSMFAEAAAMHAAAIRLDVAPAIIFGGDPNQPPDFSGLDEVVALAQQYHLQVVADLMTVPWWAAECPAPTPLDQMDRCPPADLSGYRSMIEQIVARADPVIRYWEVWNEPDTPEFFTGTPQQYANMLRAAHDAVKAVDPADQVLLGGISSSASMPWLGQVFATPGADAVHAFDIANVHERGVLASLAPDLTAWRSYLRSYGFTGPLWVTEHGYPSDPAFQYDSAFAQGPVSQATYLQASIPTLLDAGAAEVFLTERDNLQGPFASEGLLGGDVADPPPADPSVIEKPAYQTVQRLAACYAATGLECPQPAPVATPAQILFPVTRLGAAVTAKVAISDPGGEPITLDPAAVTDAGATAVSITTDACAGQILEPGATCSIALRYKPALGSGTGSLDIASDNGSVSVPLAVAAASAADLSPPPTARLRFRPVHGLDGPGDPQRLSLAITDGLPSAVAIRRVGVAGRPAPDLSVQSQTCAPRRLMPSRHCYVSVVFTPTRAGTRSAVLTMSGTGSPLRIALSATAFPRPAILRVQAESGNRRCHTARSIRVWLDQPATVHWQIAKIAPPPAGCPAGNPLAARAALGASGRATTAGSAGRLDGIPRYAVRITPLHQPRPAHGRYELILSATNRHGTGRPRSLWVSM